MADLEAVLADVSYLMAMEKSKSTPAARASKKIILPDPRYTHFSISRTSHQWRRRLSTSREFGVAKTFVRGRATGNSRSKATKFLRIR